MFPQRSQVIQGSFPGGRPRVAPPVGRPGQPGRPVVQPAVPSYVTPLDPTRLNLGGVGGSALPEPVQRKMEAFYKTDFSDVRVHVGPQAASIGALAFTLGSNIYFAPGQYNPHSQQGQQLLGHELAHVLQQRAGRVRNPQGSGVAVVQDPHLEAEADRLGRQAAAQPMLPVGGPAVQRPGLVQAKPAASLPGVRPVAPHVQAALAAVGQPHRPGLVQAKPAASLLGARPVAPHVQTAVMAGAQPKMPMTQPGVRTPALHMQAALAAVGQPQRPGLVQAKGGGEQVGFRSVALPPVAARIQPQVQASALGGRSLAPHVQAVVTACAQPKLSATPPGRRSLAPHVQAAVAAVGQAKLPNATPGEGPRQQIPMQVIQLSRELRDKVSKADNIRDQRLILRSYLEKIGRPLRRWNTAEASAILEFIMQTEEELNKTLLPQEDANAAKQTIANVIDLIEDIEDRIKALEQSGEGGGAGSSGSQVPAVMSNAAGEAASTAVTTTAVSTDRSRAGRAGRGSRRATGSGGQKGATPSSAPGQADNSVSDHTKLLVTEAACALRRIDKKQLNAGQIEQSGGQEADSKLTMLLAYVAETEKKANGGNAAARAEYTAMGNTGLLKKLLWVEGQFNAQVSVCNEEIAWQLELWLKVIERQRGLATDERRRARHQGESGDAGSPPPTSSSSTTRRTPSPSPPPDGDTL